MVSLDLSITGRFLPDVILTLTLPGMVGGYGELAFTLHIIIFTGHCTVRTVVE